MRDARWLVAGLLFLPSAALAQWVAQGAPTPLTPPTVDYSNTPLPAAPIQAAPLPPPGGTSGPAPGRAAAPAATDTNPAASTPGADQAGPADLWPNKWLPGNTAELQVLNKIDAARQNLTVKVGQTADYGSLSIKVQACVIRPPDQPANAAAFLVISDSLKGEPGFTGWSLANEPWVAMLQNPVYNVRVVGCS